MIWVVVGVLWVVAVVGIVLFVGAAARERDRQDAYARERSRARRGPRTGA